MAKWTRSRLPASGRVVSVVGPDGKPYFVKLFGKRIRIDREPSGSFAKITTSEGKRYVIPTTVPGSGGSQKRVYRKIVSEAPSKVGKSRYDS